MQASDFQYTPDDDIEVHTEGAITLICKAFQSHDAGIPEWVKNAADEYARRDTEESNRLIGVFFDAGARSRRSSISVLDFSGMTAEVIEKYFRRWADPDASSRGGSSTGVQGGHGNGGKCYMTMMFDDHAFLHTVRDGNGSRYGVQGGRLEFGYIPDRERGRSFEVTDPPGELRQALRDIGVKSENLPLELREAVEACAGFTLVTGQGPKGYRGRIPVPQLVAHIRDHAQMIRTIDFCSVHVLSNGRPLKEASPLRLEPVDPDPAFSEPRMIPVPEGLVDPQTGEPVSTTDEGALESGVLTLRTSNKSMRWKRKARHTIIYHGVSGYIGYVEVPRLGVTSAYQDRIYGECRLKSLESAKQNAREGLANTPLTRAVETFVRDQVQELSEEFEARERRSVEQREKEELSQINEVLDRWKNQFMSDLMSGLVGDDGPGTPPRPPLPSGKAARIEVSLSSRRAGIGVSFRPTIKFYNKSDTRIRAEPYRWISEDTNVAWVDDTLNVVNTFSRGKTRLWAETLDGRVRSNEVDLEVVKIRSISLEPAELEMPVGSMRQIKAFSQLSSGEVLTDVVLVWTEDDPTVARVSAIGSVYGGGIGETYVIAGDDHCMAESPVRIQVVEPEEGGGGGGRGRSYPRILISSVDPDPETGDMVEFSPDDPPVWQRPVDVDRNIFWINSSAPFARMYLDQEAGYGWQSREWRIYHIERYIEVIAQIALVNDPDLAIMDVESWLVSRGTRVAEIQAAAADSLRDFIRDGTQPEGV